MVLGLPNPGLLSTLDSPMDSAAAGFGDAIGATGADNDANAALARMYRFLGGRFAPLSKYVIKCMQQKQQRLQQQPQQLQGHFGNFFETVHIHAVQGHLAFSESQSTSEYS